MILFSKKQVLLKVLSLSLCTGLFSMEKSDRYSHIFERYLDEQCKRESSRGEDSGTYNLVAIQSDNHDNSASLPSQQQCDYANDASSRDMDDHFHDQTWDARREMNERDREIRQEAMHDSLTSQDENYRHDEKSESLCPLTDIMQKISSRLLSDKYRDQLQEQKTTLKAEIEGSWFFQNTESQNKQCKFIDALVDGSINQLLHKIQHANAKEASTAFGQLRSLWPWPHGKSYLVRWMTSDEAVFTGLIKRDIMQDAERCLVSRHDYIALVGGWRALDDVKFYEEQYRDMQIRGDKNGLDQEKERLDADILDQESLYDISIKARFVAVSSLLADPLTQIFSTIANGELHVAENQLEEFKGQLLADHGSMDVAREQMIEHEGFDAFAVAQNILESRSDYQVQLYEQREQQSAFMVNDFEHIDVQQQIISVLDNSHDYAVVASKTSELADHVFINAQNCNYIVLPEVESSVYASIDTMSMTQNPQEFVFHLASVDHVLTDIQNQTALQVAQAPTLLERSPELFARAVQKFVTALNPVTQVKNFCEFWIGTAHFVSDVTLGKLYLSPEDYQNRIDGFWDTIDALHPENLAQLTAEQWVDLGAQMAADFVYVAGVGKTIRYLKNIDAIGKTQRQAAKVASRFKKAVDNSLAKNPIAITAEGVLLRVSDEIGELGTTVKVVIKDADGLIRNSKEISQRIAQNAEMIIKHIEKPLEDLAKNGNKIKKISKKIFKVPHTFSPEHITDGILKIGDATLKIDELAGNIATQFIGVIKKADTLNLLKDGPNNILTYINGIPIEIRAFIKNDTLISFNAFVKHSTRQAKNIVKM